MIIFILMIWNVLNHYNILHIKQLCTSVFHISKYLLIKWIRTIKWSIETGVCQGDPLLPDLHS